MKNENRDFDKDAATWDEGAGRIRMASDIANTILEAINLNDDMKVLDFGCGTGLLTLKLQPLVGSITGVDSSSEMLKVLNKKIESQNLSNLNTQRMDIERGDRLVGNYDLIISSMTLHHIREIRPIIEQFYKITVPQGHICIADLDPDDGLFHGNNQGVFHFGFDRYLMRQMCMEAGFDNIEFRQAAEVVRCIPGGVRPFTIFLLTGQRIK